MFLASANKHDFKHTCCCTTLFHVFGWGSSRKQCNSWPTKPRTSVARSAWSCHVGGTDHRPDPRCDTSTSRMCLFFRLRTETATETEMQEGRQASRQTGMYTYTWIHPCRGPASTHDSVDDPQQTIGKARPECEIPKRRHVVYGDF